MDDYRKQDQGEVWKAEYEDERLSIHKIAKRHHAPDTLVRDTLKNLGLDTGARIKERKVSRQGVAQALASGKTPKQLAAELGVTRATIYVAMRDIRSAASRVQLWPTPNGGFTDKEL